MVLKWEANKRARAAAVAEAETFMKSTEPQPPKEEPYKVPAKFLPGGFTDEDIDPFAKQRSDTEKERKEQKARTASERRKAGLLASLWFAGI